jgi:hypothetical protein
VVCSRPFELTRAGEKNHAEKPHRTPDPQAGSHDRRKRRLHARSICGIARRLLALCPFRAYEPASRRAAAVHAEDCGPCLQTVINLSLAAGARPEILRAAVEENLAAMDEETKLAFEFARLLSARDARSEDLRSAVERRWGKAGLAEIALAIASTRVFPTVKRAMGYAQACQRVVIAGEATNAASGEARAA